jgi:hypothetical protein
MNKAVMSEAYARGGQPRNIAGGVILILSSLLAAILVAAGLMYAMGTSARHEAAITAADCEPGLAPDGLQCTTAQMLTSQYTAIVTPASQQLATDMAAYTASERRNLAAAHMALTAEVMSEHAFGTNLAAIKFPVTMAPIAQALIQANQARAKLTAEQAQSTSLAQLRSFNHQVQAANAAVQAEMKLLSKALATNPPGAQPR